MNDLTFGATLLACFVALVVTVWIEVTSPTQLASTAISVQVRPRADHAHAKGCTTTVATAPTAAH